MNPIMRAVDIVKFRIPPQILTQVFQKQTQHWRDTPISVDEQILALVVRPRVLVDCNLVGGAEVVVDLSGLPSENLNTFEVVYRIPKDRTQGRSIMSVLSIGYGASSMMAQSGGNAGFKAGSITPVTLAGQAMADAMGSMPVVSSAKVSLIGENTILIRDTASLVSNISLRCIIANDENMSHLQLRSIPQFTTLVELAVKSYIYNEMIILMDQAFLAGGQTLGRFKEVVDSYQDAEQMYNEFLEQKWKKISMMNDRESTNRFLRMMIGSHR